MATAKEVIDSAAFRIGLKKEGIDLETSEYNTGIALLNDMMFELDAINIKLGYSEVSAQTDSITIPSYALGMVKAKMAIKLNGELVVDNVVLENYWERDKPIYETGQIELQNHGNKLYFRKIFLRELDAKGEPKK